MHSPMDKKSLKEQLKSEAKKQFKDLAKGEAKQLKELIKDLTPEQRDALRARLTSRDRKAQLRPRVGNAEVPLSFAQEREWFRYRLFPGIAHNISGALRLEGNLSLPALQQTLEEIVRRHETLRATVVAPEGSPVLTIRPPCAVPVEVIESSDRTWHMAYAVEMARPFDLSRDLLLRATLVRLSERDHVLLLTLHHIAADGWSIGVVMHELAELYAASVQSRKPELPELSVQYGDFALWQRQRLQDHALDKHLSYWREQLENLPPVLELSPDRLTHSASSSEERDHEAASCQSRLSAALVQALQELSRRENTTLFVTLLTAFMVLLMRCTGREDVLIGSPVSGRTRVETEPLVGLFLNTLALRAQLSPRLSFRKAMTLVRASVLNGLEHAEAPVERIVQELDIQRSSTAHPLYETIFNFTPGAPRHLDLPDLHVRLEDAPALIEEFSTQLFVTDAVSGLDLDLRYRKQRYTEARMSCFLEQYVAILEQVAADATLRIGSLDLVTSRSRAVLADPTIALEKPAHQNVPASIAAWVAHTPEQPAICQGNETVTYAELGARIAALANTLHAEGLQPGDVVAVAGRRGADVVIAMAAVLEAGGVLLTLSPDLPEHRQQVMLEEADARFVIDSHGVQQRRAAAFPRHGRIENQTTTQAYVFFTSGSTGKPKGVLGTHAGLAHWLAWQRETFAVGPGDRCGQLTALSFDVVLRDVFLPLTSGATLVIPTESDASSARATLQWLDRERVSLLHSVPAVVETWLLSNPAGVTLASLKRIFFAGEPLTSALVTRWREAFPLAGEIVNVYGPTETSLAKFFYRVPAEPRAGVQPLGNALPQTQALVLTPERALCGVGEPGEIAIRTPFRSLGYINTPEDNEKRFIKNPFRDDADDLVYLTGDRGVIGADGLLEFRGRVDHQVKVRGVRVEPMEVTITLQSGPGVATCAVIAREDGDDGPTLVAYVVLEDSERENIARLQEFVAQRLPAAMVPSAFVFMDSLPLTSNQKLDRDRLPAPLKTRPTLESRYVAPRDAIELQLVEIWEKLLDVRPIGVTDRFFEVGGHSLLALRLLVEVEQRLGTKVPLPALFEEPTIAHLSAVLRRNTNEWPLTVTLRSGEHPRKLFLVHPGGGILWNYVQLVRHLPAGMPIYGLQARGLDGLTAPHLELEKLATDYIAEIRGVQPRGPYQLAGHSFGGMIAFEMARQLKESGDEVELLAMFDSALPKSREHAAEDDARSLVEMARTIERFVGKDLGISYESLVRLSGDEQVEYVATSLARNDALLPGHGVELTRNLLHVSKAHVHASRSFTPRISPVPITLIRARDGGSSDDESLGWSAFSTSPVRVLWTPGDHVTMMSEPNVQSLAMTLNVILSEQR